MDGVDLSNFALLGALLVGVFVLFREAVRGNSAALGWGVFNLFAAPVLVWVGVGFAAFSLFALCAVVVVLWLFFVGA